MRIKIFAAIIAAAFLMTGVNSSYAQEKSATKTAKVEQKTDKKAAAKTKATKESNKKAKTHTCTDKEKSSCSQSCENE
ncbi:MAG: hypothetical protein ACM3S2_02300 [Ignavibacteriales bacterium]